VTGTGREDAGFSPRNQALLVREGAKTFSKKMQINMRKNTALKRYRVDLNVHEWKRRLTPLVRNRGRRGQSMEVAEIQSCSAAMGGGRGTQIHQKIS